MGTLRPAHALEAPPLLLELQPRDHFEGVTEEGRYGIGDRLEQLAALGELGV